MTAWTHIPIMAAEIADLLLTSPEGTYIDGTLGLGGHTRYFLTRLGPHACIFGFDKDEEALEMARQNVADKRLTSFHASYVQAPQLLAQAGIDRVDGILLDLGLSSYQLDNPARGFSLLNDGPLDMRFDLQNPLTAATIVNTWPLEELIRILRDFGEERHAEKIALAILRARRETCFTTTRQLAALVETVVPRRGKIHPATQTFQALRIACNKELENVQDAIAKLPALLKPAGRMAVLTFHSLEDRIVKNCFKNLVQNGGWKLVNKHALAPGYEEVRQNRRARSAKLRVLERTL